MRNPLPLTLVATTLCLALPSQKLDGRTWTYDKFGIELKVPQDYSSVPLQIDEQWISAKFLSDKTYLSKDRDWNHEHRVLMRVILFTEKAKKGSAAEVHEEKDGSTFIGIGAVPYQGYRDYIKRHRRGFHFSDEKEDKVDGTDCLMCEVKVDKGTPKLRLYTAVFHQPKFELAIEFEVLEDRHKQLEKECLRCLRSVRFHEPVAEASAPKTMGRRTSTRLWTAFREEWKKRTYPERKKIREEMEHEHHQKVRKKTPSDWTISESEHFLIVSHADDKFTKRMTEGAEVFYDWCEKNFRDLGDDYVRRPVLRLCRDWDEYKAFHFDSSGTTGWSLVGNEREIGTYYDNYNGTSGRDVSYLFSGILQHYLQEVDPHIVTYTPYWLTRALNDYVSECYIKGRKLDFKVEDWARDEARTMHREGKLPKLQEILTMDAAAYNKMRSADSRSAYAVSQALRYVLVGPGKRDKNFKDFLKRYFQAAIDCGNKYSGSSGSKGYRSAETEEEEERLAKEYRDRVKEQAKLKQQEINDAMLGGISEKQWQKHEKSYAAFVKKGR